ncbi:MAG: putative LacI/HTH-type transcriptional regulator [Rhodobacteraceae bacterium]|nr:MAG: putative LacI/HTH-type transcriptional regulator [Paracoccaceae bacterium]
MVEPRDRPDGIVPKKPTMTEIAVACGVSQATVSLVLNHAPGTRISPTTRDMVLKKAAELGYHVAHRAAGRRPVIAMLINDVTSSPHVAGLIDGVSDAANDAGFLVTVIPTSGDDEAEESAIGFLASLPVAGVIYTRLVTQEVVVPPRLTDWPCILLNCYVAKDSLPSVVPGDQAAGVTATFALLDAGHRRIAFIGGDESIEASHERLKGYKRALATRDVPYDPALVVKGGWTISGGYKALKKLLTFPDPPTAVFCFCDRTAVGVYNAATEAGLVVGRDLSVIGFDNEAYTADMLPPLTTMELPHADMARHAVEDLVALIDRQKALPRPTRLKFDCPMIKRQSVAAPLPRSETV